MSSPAPCRREQLRSPHRRKTSLVFLPRPFPSMRSNTFAESYRYVLFQRCSICSFHDSHILSVSVPTQHIKRILKKNRLSLLASEMALSLMLVSANTSVNSYLSCPSLAGFLLSGGRGIEPKPMRTKRVVWYSLIMLFLISTLLSVTLLCTMLQAHDNAYFI